jgi:hypothetical protein
MGVAVCGSMTFTISGSVAGKIDIRNRLADRQVGADSAPDGLPDETSRGLWRLESGKPRIR